MSRPNIPLTWRQTRIAAAAALATLAVTICFTQPADAGPEPPTTLPATASPATLPAHHQSLAAALRAQSAAQGAAHREAVEKAQKAQRERQARERAAAKAAAAREQARAEEAARKAQQRVTRQQQRPKATTLAAGTLSGARSYARARLSSAQYQCLSSVVTRESGWNPRATNPSSGAYGLFQALPASKMASAGSDWRTNPLTQMRWGLSYMESRYGSPCGAWNFWQKNGWY